MPELRHDELTGRTVLVAPARATRPHSVPAAPAGTGARARCPFCAGHEHETPPEVARLGAGPADSRGWRARVVPNKYPLVGDGVAGAHEVAVLSPDHDRDLAALAPQHARDVLRLVRDRAAAHLDGGLGYALAFVNHGRAAGASIAHPHAQVVALATVPPAVLADAARWRAAGDDLLACSQQRAAEHGLVLAGGLPGGDAPGGVAVAWCPWAAATPYETLVAHPDAGSDFASAPDHHVEAVADTVRDVLGRVGQVLGLVPYNVVFHGVPGGRWYARVTVRTFTHAGFEMGTGILANTVPPEVAAAQLREPS